MQTKKANAIKRFKRRQERDMQQLIDKAAESLKDDYDLHVANILTNIFAALLITLRDDLSFGNKRLVRFMQSLDGQLEAMGEGYVNYKDIIDTVREETGFDLVNVIQSSLKSVEIE